MILLNPGPVNVSERVRRALLQPDICHREGEFTELLRRVQHKLLKAFVPGAESEYVAAVISGSGTAAVEAAVLSSVPHGKRVLVLNNGVYGERLSLIANGQKIAVPEVKMDWGKRPTAELIKQALKVRPEVQTVAMVHHETTTGLMNPAEEISEAVDSLGRVFVLDSVSGLGGEPLNIAGSHMYLVAGTAGKCIQGFPGVSFVLVRRGFLDRMRTYPKRSWYLSLPQYVDEQGNGAVPFTPAVQIYYAFDEALNELLEEGVAKRIQRLKRAATLIRQKMSDLGVKALLPADVQSNSLTSYLLPDGLAYDVLHDRLKERGYVIYAGQGALASKIFRIANMGALTESDLQGFLTAFQEVLEAAVVSR
ncbi:2-aminoethylphosphonate--pyruvate transaminase [Nitrospira sp.]|nr:2-aminoethylphosphonate--pyruvate transaminase [Nitrospira sp.]